jgi:hypothetical protein
LYRPGARDLPEFDFISIETGLSSRRIPAPPDAIGAVITLDTENIAFGGDSAV